MSRIDMNIELNTNYSYEYVLSSKNTYEYSAPRVGAHFIYDYSYEYVLSSKNIFLVQEYF